MATNLFDILKPEDQEKVKKWADARFKPQHDTDIPPELYTIAELGCYFGWGAVQDVLRGHIESRTKDDKVELIPLRLEMAVGLCRAARKVRYKQIIEEGDIATAAHVASRASQPSRAYDQFIKPYKDKTK